MKLKINQACDLSSISVLPPPARRPNTGPSGPQASQLRSQASQQSFSQGFSSQPNFFSQISQNSVDEAPDQRFCSQERENSAKKVSCFPQSIVKRDENQMPISRSSPNVMRKWGASSVSEHRCQISEELEHRLGMIETSINRFGMILDSVQSDVMQVNKGTKEVLLETEGIRQKLNAEDALRQQMNKGLEDIKTSLDGGLKSLSDQLSNNMHLDKLEQISLLLSTLPTQMEASISKLQNELQNSFTKELQAIAGSLKTLNQSNPVAAAILPKHTGPRATPERKPEPPRNPVLSPKARIQSALHPKTEVGNWKSVKPGKSTFIEKPYLKENKGKGVTFTQQARDHRVLIESDEEIDEGFSCFFGKKEQGVSKDSTFSLSQEAKEETDRILRRARRQKRKYSNPIIIN